MVCSLRQVSMGRPLLFLGAIIGFWCGGGANAFGGQAGLGVHRRLETRISVSFSHTPVREAFAAIARCLKLTLVWNKQNKYCYDSIHATMVTLRTRSPERAQTVLRQLTQGVLGGTLDWTADEHSLIVASPILIGKYTVLRIYNVAPLVLVRVRRGVWYLDKNRRRNLIKIIENSVNRNSWIDNGGVVGSIRAFQSSLIVKCERRDQWKIQKILANLEAADAATRATYAPNLRVP